MSAGRHQSEQSRPRWPLVRDGLALLAVILGIFLAVVIFLPAEGRIAAPVHHAVAVLLGRATFVLPVALTVAGIAVLERSLFPERPLPLARLTGAGLVALALVPSMHLVGLDPSQSLARAEAGQGGGLVGHWLGLGLLEWLGGPATTALLAGALALGALLAFDLTVGEVWGATSRSLAWVWCHLVQPARTRRAIASSTRSGGLQAVAVAPGSGTRAARGWHWPRALGGAWRRAPARRLAAAALEEGPTPDVTLNRSGFEPAHPAMPPAETSRAASRTPAPAAGSGGRPASPPTGEPRPAWTLPAATLFKQRVAASVGPGDLKARARIIEETLASFNIDARVVETNQGPAVTQFGVEPAQGVAVNRILSRQNDLALRLGTSPIRLEAPVPGKRMVGVEVPNSAIATVTLRDVVESHEWERARGRLRIVLGRDVSGRAIVGDLARMPHLLIAGATGSGKSVCINAIVGSLLYQFTPDELQLVMIDPKRVELAPFTEVPHLRLPVVTEMDRVVGVLKWVVLEMERRYKLFAERGVRNLEGFNRLAVDAPDSAELRLPFLVVVIDELADMMMTAAEEVEKKLCRLAQLARATGIHLVVATQRPSVDVVTGLIKANFPTRIAFAVSSQTDSRVILDQAGAEKLLGRGDALYMPPDAMKPIRLQGAFVSDDEVQALVGHWQEQGKPRFTAEEVEQIESLGRGDDEDDDVYERAVELAETVGRVSVSLLQRRLGIGHARAQRLLDRLQEEGVAEE